MSAEPLLASGAIDAARSRSEHVLAGWLNRQNGVCASLDDAIGYSVLGTGKRLRPVLVYLAGRALGAEDNALDAPAAAIEMIHAYSLVHDDLPAMDDDDLRRGRPTVHRAFDEPLAILAGDALQTLAFEALASRPHPRLADLITTLSQAAGRDGMAAGQAIDLGAVGAPMDLAALQAMHQHKTGALIRAAVRLGALTAVEVSDPRVAALDRYAAAIGLAFQIHDDVLDVTGDTHTLGKTSGADARRDKPTYPALLGVRVAQQLEQKILEVGEHRVAAFIAEPIQGAGGVIIPPDSYWPKIREILARYEILFVADEVICGFGRTGEWFGSDHYGNAPDLMPIAKGLTSGYLPMGGVVVRDEVVDTLNEGGEFYHGFTYSGHPVAAAVALENIRILREEKIIERVKTKTAPYLQSRWRELLEHPLVGEARGVGMLGALELVKNKKTRERFADPGVGMLCREHCFRNGLVMRAVGDTMIISPPLVINEQQIDELIGKVRLCLDATAKDALG